MKETLSSDDGNEDRGNILKVARRIMIRLPISVDDDCLQQTLAFFEKVSTCSVFVLLCYDLKIVAYNSLPLLCSLRFCCQLFWIVLHSS